MTDPKIGPDGLPWEIGADGWPISPQHPANKDNRSVEEFSEQAFRLELSRLESQWLNGNEAAVQDAVRLCGQRPPTAWVREAVLSLLAGNASGPRQRKAGAKAADRSARIHFVRWDAVRELRDRKEELSKIGYEPTWEAAYENASKALEKTEAKGRPETMKDSYQLVNAALKAGKGWRWLP